MTTKKRTRFVSNQGLVRPPAYPFSPQEILDTIRANLHQQTKLKMTFERLGQLTGQETNTTHYWWSQSSHAHLLAFMCLFEQLAPARRHDILARYCRVLPTIDHPRLTHDLDNLAILIDVLRRKTGVTLITGGTDLLRCFVFTSLARAFPALGPRHPAVCGLDLHRPSDFVPVPNLIYADQANDSSQLHMLVETAWPNLNTSEAHVICLNRVWSVAGEKRADILRWSRRRHVLVADNGATRAHEFIGIKGNAVRTVLVTAAKEPAGGIRLCSF